MSLGNSLIFKYMKHVRKMCPVSNQIAKACKFGIPRHVTNKNIRFILIIVQISMHCFDTVKAVLNYLRLLRKTEYRNNNTETCFELF